MPTPFPPETVALILQLLRAGYRSSQIAKHTGAHYATVRGIGMRHGVRSKHKSGRPWGKGPDEGLPPLVARVAESERREWRGQAANARWGQSGLLGGGR